MAIFWIIIPLSVLYISKANIPIVTVANIGFSTNFVNSKFIFMFFLRAHTLIIIDTK